jgi:serine/threonine protein kinase KIN1/2
LNEMAAMQLIGTRKHPHVVSCNEILFDEQNMYIVMPYYEGQDLFDYWRANGPLSEDQARLILRPIFQGLQLLHDELHIVHLDLSPENIMIGSNGHPTIIDMGMCLRIPFDDEFHHQRRFIQCHGTCGKLPYMAPELWIENKAFDGVAVDVWSMGVVLLQMVTGTRPKTYHDECFEQLSEFTSNLTSECVDLMTNMLQADPQQRISVGNILNHPWFTGT